MRFLGVLEETTEMQEISSEVSVETEIVERCCVYSNKDVCSCDLSVSPAGGKCGTLL